MKPRPHICMVGAFKKKAKNLSLSAKRNKYLKDTIFCAQNGYKPVKILYFVVIPLDKAQMWR